MEERLREIFCNVFDLEPEQVHDELSFESIEAWDSLGHVRMVTEMEAVFGVSFSLEDVMEMLTFGKIKEICKRYGIE
jgi:acyl carrier protein